MGKGGLAALGPLAPAGPLPRDAEHSWDPLLPLCHVSLVLLALWKPQEALRQLPRRAGREKGSGELMAGEGKSLLFPL